MTKINWDNDAVQFPRLLAEIRAVGLTAQQLAALKVSMDLSTEGICEILSRAEEVFEAFKDEITNGNKVEEPVVHYRAGHVSDDPQCGGVADDDVGKPEYRVTDLLSRVTCCSCKESLREAEAAIAALPENQR